MQLFYNVCYNIGDANLFNGFVSAVGRHKTFYDVKQSGNICKIFDFVILK